MFRDRFQQAGENIRSNVSAGIRAVTTYSIQIQRTAGDAWTEVKQVVQSVIPDRNAPPISITLPLTAGSVAGLRVQETGNASRQAVSDGFIVKGEGPLGVALEWHNRYWTNPDLPAADNPVGVSADGVSRLLVRVIDNLGGQVQSVRVAVEDGGSAPVQVRTHGGLLFEASRSRLTAYSPVANADLSADPVTTVADGPSPTWTQALGEANARRLQFVFWYRAPIDFDRGSDMAPPSRTVILRITATLVGGAIK